MKVTELMTRNPVSCRPESNLAEVAGLMWEHACGAIPIVDGAGTVTGIITDRDICIALGTRNVCASDIRAMDVSAPSYFTCRPDDDIRAALRTMAAQEVRRLPVTDETGKLIGVLSIDDVVMRATPGLPVSFKDVIDTLKAVQAKRAHATLIPAEQMTATARR